jgi:hypothetical protein
MVLPRHKCSYIKRILAKAPSFPSIADIKTKAQLLLEKSVCLRKRGKEV